MAKNKRPPLELDDLTNNLKQSSGKGVDAFFSSPTSPPEEKKPVRQEEPEKEHNPNGTSNLVPPVPRVPLKRVMKERWPVNIYQDQYESLQQLALEERKQGGMGSMSQMVREAIDKLIAERRQKE
jgi:hypothetical protein